ncbi:unnamed protein product [Phytomonas sp. Hart1]|nr:unnamed protein product [Phytomonas sp. Hart1]|eukprot:CCW70057.1 unnamed protein product [Phytomonas sp. isolate Hart1]
MLSTRGAITTNVAMFECASGQSVANRQVFLLSELEKTWVSVSVILRRLLIEGKDVKIDNFGSFWMENHLCLMDPIYHERYYVRKLCFGMNAKFVNQYGIDDYKVPLEKPNRRLHKLHAADVVRLCAIPARTVTMALQEFYRYIGEGLHCGRVFSLYFPGVATVVLKKERMMLTLDSELEKELFDLDSRRWPPEKRLAGAERLAAGKRRASGSRSVASGRPCARPPAHPTELRPVFIPAAPTGRLFSDIEKDAERRRKTLQEKDELQQETRRLRDDEVAAGYKDVQTRLHQAEIETYRTTTTTRESVYDIVETESPRAEEPEIEAVEEIPVENEPDTEATSGRFLGLKNAELEAILIKEEPFSRPTSRLTFHDPNSARDLIYGGGKTAATRLNEPEMHYGRKRFDSNLHDVDRVGSLLKGVS